MEKKKITQKKETMIKPNKIIKHTTKKEIIDLQAKLKRINADELISEAINSANNNEYQILKEKNLELLEELRNNTVSNYIEYLSEKDKNDIKKQFIKEIDTFKTKSDIIINKKDEIASEYKSKLNYYSKENKIINEQLNEFNSRFISLQKELLEKEEEIIKLKEKLNMYRENEKLLNTFYDNFHEKEPLDIVKSYKKKHQGEIALMEENEKLKLTIKYLKKRMEEESDRAKKHIKNMRDKIDDLIIERNELYENHSDKLGELDYLYQSNKKLQEKNNLLHNMLYQLYNKLFEAFKLDKNINLKEKYKYITQEDFVPNVYDDEEIARYIKIMIASSKPALCDQLLRETVANANMILRIFLKNNVNLNLRFDPVVTFRELKAFMENREDKIKNLEAKLKKYQIILNSSETNEKKYENIIRSYEEEKNNKSYFEKKRKGSNEKSVTNSIFIKKSNQLIDNSNIITSNITNEILKTNITKDTLGEENKSIKDKKKLILPQQILLNQTPDITSTKNNTYENNNISIHTNTENKFRPKSSYPNIKTYKKLKNIEYNENKERMISSYTTQNKTKKTNYYKDPKYQSFHSFKVNSKHYNSYSNIHYKKIRKIAIDKKGNILKENGSKKFVTYMKDLQQFINHNNRLILYRSKISPNKFNSFSHKLKNNIKVFSVGKKPYEKKIKNRIIGKINELIGNIERKNKYIQEVKKDLNKIAMPENN